MRVMVSPFQKDTINNFHWFVTVLFHLTVYQKSFHIITYLKIVNIQLNEHV